jgi:hypothetical protein
VIGPAEYVLKLGPGYIVQVPRKGVISPPPNYTTFFTQQSQLDPEFAERRQQGWQNYLRFFEKIYLPKHIQLQRMQVQLQQANTCGKLSLLLNTHLIPYTSRSGACIRGQKEIFDLLKDVEKGDLDHTILLGLLVIKRDQAREGQKCRPVNKFLGLFCTHKPSQFALAIQRVITGFQAVADEKKWQEAYYHYQSDKVLDKNESSGGPRGLGF